MFKRKKEIKAYDPTEEILLALNDKVAKSRSELEAYNSNKKKYLIDRLFERYRATANYSFSYLRDEEDLTQDERLDIIKNQIINLKD